MFEREKKNEGGESVASLIDEDMRITGTVVSSGDIILAGGVEGEIQCRHLFVEDQAKLTGNINAEETVIAGVVSGEVSSGILRIKSTGNFDGILKTSGIEVEEGAIVNARFRKRRR